MDRQHEYVQTCSPDSGNLPPKTLALGDYMDEADFASLEKMYTLFRRVDGTTAVINSFRNHIKVSLSYCPLYFGVQPSTDNCREDR